MEDQADPIQNAWVGCVWPILRNFFLLGLAIGTGLMAAGYSQNIVLGILAFVAIEGLSLVLWHRRKAVEDRATRQFFGLRND